MMKEIGERIRARRKAKGWPEMELAYRVKLSISGLRKIERGESSARIGTLAAIAKELDMTLSALVDDTAARMRPLAA